MIEDGYLGGYYTRFIEYCKILMDNVGYCKSLISLYGIFTKRGVPNDWHTSFEYNIFYKSYV